MLPGAVDKGFVQPIHDAVAQAIAQAGEYASFLCHVFLSDGASLAQANDTGDVQGAGAHAAFVASAVNDGGKLNSGILPADVQRTYALGAIHFVTRDRHQVDILLVHVDWNLAHGLSRVGMEDHAALMTQLPNFFD